MLEASSDDTQPEILAHHAEEAGETKKAITYWAQAGDNAFDAAGVS